MQKPIFDWAVALARRFEPEAHHEWSKAFYETQHRAADRLVLSHWREALGGRLKFVIVGGAALRPELVRVFGAAGVDVLQGYGLTETSPIIAYNRPNHNRPGTVGELLPGVQVKLSRSGEILTRGPQVMKGYFNRPEETAKAIDQDGWFHTGDLGEMSADGFLTITGRLKHLFKLSTGEYVMPQPLEGALEAHPQIEHALVIGEGEKYAAALLFLSSGTDPETVKNELRSYLQRANRALPRWSQVKRALLLTDTLSIDNDLLTPTLKVKRSPVLKRYQAETRHLFEHTPEGADAGRIVKIETR